MISGVGSIHYCSFLKMVLKAKKFIFAKQFSGFPVPSDLELVEEDLPSIKDGEFLAEAVYLSVDPYMRKYSDRMPLQSTVVGSQVARILESKNSSFPAGQYVVANFGWRTHTISNGEPPSLGVPVFLLPTDLGDLPLSLPLGVLGMPGHTAYFAFVEILEPKSGQTLVVSGAAGAVGSHVGQIAKIKGIAGSEEKGKWLTEELGFDNFIDYKTQNVADQLKAIAPEGIDLYFDNVGGEVTTAVLNNMKTFGRISACGSISGYNDEKVQKVSPIQPAMVRRQLWMQGFQILAWTRRWDEAFKQNLEWVKQGKLKYKETVTEGFENMFEAFTDMLRGGNTGKAIVKV